MAPRPKPEILERENEALLLRKKEWPLAAIAAKLGYANESGVSKAIARALDRAPKAHAPELRRMELEKLALLEYTAWQVLERQHLVVITGGPKAGMIVSRFNQAGEKEELEDSAPVLAAIDRIIRVQERRSRLMGLDAPVRHRVTTITEDMVDAEMRRLSAQLAGLDEEDDDHDDTAAVGPGPTANGSSA